MTRSINEIMTEVGQTISDLNAAVCVAFSGGCDSTALLDVASRFLPKERLRAIHINHGWSEHSDVWAEDCRRRAAELNVSYLTVRVDARPMPGQSPEAVARTKRYEALANHIDAGEILLTAHHRDDQALTVLLQLLRGAGSAGLSGMPVSAQFGKGFMMRPLLHITAKDIKDYAISRQLKWIEDESNAQTDYDRNYLRLKVVPLLETRWPGWSKTLARSAGHLAELTEILTEDIVKDYARCAMLAMRADEPPLLSRKQLMCLSLPRRKQVLRHWFQEAGLDIPRTTTIRRLTQGMEQNMEEGCLARQGKAEIHLYRNRLYIVPDNPTIPVNFSMRDWPAETNLELPEIKTTLLWRELIKQAPSLAHKSKVSVGFRKGGEQCLRHGKNGDFHHNLKKIFQSHDYPPWLRSRTPLIYADNRLRLVWGVTACD